MNGGSVMSQLQNYCGMHCCTRLFRGKFKLNFAVCFDGVHGVPSLNTVSRHCAVRGTSAFESGRTISLKNVLNALTMYDVPT